MSIVMGQLNKSIPKDILAVIPARGGSKGIPRKNLRTLAGKPLVMYTIEAAKKSQWVSRVLVSTDDEEIKSISVTAGAEVPYLRPAELATDDVHAIEVVLHALSWLREKESYIPEVVVMLLPTSPLRRADAIDEAIKRFFMLKVPSVVSVVRCAQRLVQIRYIRGGALVPVMDLPNPNIQRQDCEPIFAVNGAIYVASPATIETFRTFHVPRAIAFEMESRHSLDIDTVDDLELAEYYLEKRRGEN